MSIKLLLAGPGTGKTTSIRELISSKTDLSKILILSYTNATVQDLLENFRKHSISITERNCSTLHKYALKINPQKGLHILNTPEEEILIGYSTKLGLQFEDLCRTLNCITFKQMISQTASFFDTNPAFIDEIISEIDLLIVDEYQDFNPLERELIKKISEHAKEVIYLGDDDQCIYEFKGADTEGILDLYNEPNVENIKHKNICYRCPDNVVDACTALIQHNKQRVIKPWIKNNNNGDVVIKQFINGTQTNEYIFDTIKTIKESDEDCSIMVLSPVEFAATDLMKHLSSKEFTYTNLWNTRADFQEMEKIWEARLVLGQNKVLNLLLLIFGNIRSNKKFINDIKKVITNVLDSKELIELVKKKNIFTNDLAELVTKGSTVEEFIKTERYTFLEPFLHQETINDDLEGLTKLVLDTKNFDNKGINFLSIHKSKGLQADYVFILGLVEGILPNTTKGLDSIEKQRRLLFVGMSRASRGLFLISTINWPGHLVNKVEKRQFKYDYVQRIYKGRASSFINELKA